MRRELDNKRGQGVANRRTLIAAGLAVGMLGAAMLLPGCRCSEPVSQDRYVQPNAAPATPKTTTDIAHALPKALAHAEAATPAAAKALPQPATWNFAVARPIVVPAAPLSLSDLPPLVNKAKAAVRRSVVWPSGAWGAGPMTVRTGGAQLMARLLPEGLALELPAQGLRATLVRGVCSLRGTHMPDASGSATTCDPVLSAWMAAHLAVWATGSLGDTERILRSHTAPNEVVVEMASRKFGFRWAVVLHGGVANELRVPYDGGELEVHLAEGGWEVAGAEIPTFAVLAKGGQPVGATGLSMLELPLPSGNLETDEPKIAGHLQANKVIVLGPPQLVGRFDGAAFVPTALHLPIWGKGKPAKLAKPTYETRAHDMNFGPLLQKLGTKSGAWRLQLGEQAVTGSGHVILVHSASN
ncbi:MAG: hypothetical protein KC502_20710 [Myxococcales bacterium]|nr:hypothetical protein [Myxococcales bacterium]